MKVSSAHKNSPILNLFQLIMLSSFNFSFERDLVSAVEHMALLQDESTSKVAGTTCEQRTTRASI